MVLIVVLYLTSIISIQSKTYRISHTISSNFLQSHITFPMKYEESRETIETRRELCLDEYRQQERSYKWRYRLSPDCAQYCTITKDCQKREESSACVNPLWPLRTIKYVQKYKRICYIRITEILQYEQAEQICHRYGLQLAIIDNIQLLERLKQLNMFNITCKGQCPKTRGYYIGLKRLLNSKNQSESKWIWSNNVTWTQNDIDCDDYSNTSYVNTNLLCYIGNDGQKKVTIWNKNEPNNYESDYYQVGEQCVEIVVYTDKKSLLEQIGKLNDIPCTKPTLGAICQMKDIKPFNFTRFESFAKIIDFNKTEISDKNLLFTFKNIISANLNMITVMTEILEDLLNLSSFTMKQTIDILNIFDQLINITGQIEVENDSLKLVTNKLLQFLNLFPAKIQIENKQNLSFQYENIHITILDINFENESNQWFRINTDNYQENINKHSNIIIEINIQALQTKLIKSNNYRIIEIIFANFNLFPQINMTNIGIPISYQIANLTTIKTNEDLIRFQIQVSDSLQSYNLSCVYWSFDKNNGSWITDNGCRFVGYVNNYAQCYCNHLTHFALLMISEPEQTLELLSTVEEFVLTFVTYIGICLSIFGLIITLITYVFFRYSSRHRSHISLIMLCLSILFVNCLYIPFSLTQSNLSKIKRHISCTILGFLFHYFFIASFMWMLIMAIVQYIHFVRIFNAHISHFFIKSCIIGWIIPLIFPCLVIFFGSNGGYTIEHRCWINHQILLYSTFLVPISIIVIFKDKKKYSKFQLGATLCCFVSIGCTWFFGILVFIDPSFSHQLIFCICNSFQGFLIFLFHVYLSKPKRALWQTFFIERGFHQRSPTSHDDKDLRTISHSTSRNTSGITRSDKFCFSQTSTSLSIDQQVSLTQNNSKRNEVLNAEQLQLNGLSNVTIHT
ncbi:unnamed protein product [Rotaria sp. Silwood1]|nr:unnamed protein product [Rotaria sp. Silwood1]